MIEILEKLFLTSVTMSLVTIALIKPAGKFEGKWYQLAIGISAMVFTPLVIILGLVLIWVK